MNYSKMHYNSGRSKIRQMLRVLAMQKMRLIGWLLIGATAILVGRGYGYATSITNRSGINTRPAGAPKPVSALVQDEPTAVNGYPGSTETPAPATSEAYPAIQSSPAPAGTVTPYPGGTASDDSSPTPVPIIGEETETATTPEAAGGGRQINAQQATRGRLFLWGGFVVALLLFMTGIAGSIVLFMRRQG